MTENKNIKDSTILPSFGIYVLVISSIMLITGLFVSRAFMSIGMAGLALPFFIWGFKNNIRFASRSWLFLSSVAVVAILALTSLYSEDKEYLQHRMMLKLSLILFPMAWISMRKLSHTTLRFIVYVFIVEVGLIALAGYWNYFRDFADITERYIAGQVIPLPFKVTHTRYSLMLVIAIFLSYFILIEKKFISGKPLLEKRLLIAFLFLNLAFLHLLSVRSGLLAFYASLIFFIGLKTFQKKKYILGLSALSGTLLLPFVLYHTVPTIHNKADYMIRDVNLFLSGKMDLGYSDNNRLVSMMLALELIKEQPWTGVGIGDVQHEMFALYEQKFPTYPSEFRLIPHNQFLFIWLASGIAGLLAFFCLVLSPFFHRTLLKYIFPLLIQLIFISSFISEATLENQLGSMLYGFTFWLSIAYAERLQAEENIKPAFHSRSEAHD
ncbi:MAG: O-antigen ligase family protein [Cytophagaceae bacterium]|jgi:O-antigen ligase|nr:O-antigen ligase family protein [Cytophagaceae bacterium]